jgi:hypothetical protein
MKKRHKNFWYEYFRVWFIEEYEYYLKKKPQELKINPVEIQEAYNEQYRTSSCRTTRRFRLKTITKWLKTIIEEFNLNPLFEESDLLDNSAKPTELTNNTESNTLNIIEFKGITFNSGVIEIGDYIISGTFTLQLKSN